MSSTDTLGRQDKQNKEEGVGAAARGGIGRLRKPGGRALQALRRRLPLLGHSRSRNSSGGSGGGLDGSQEGVSTQSVLLLVLLRLTLAPFFGNLHFFSFGFGSFARVALFFCAFHIFPRRSLLGFARSGL